MKLLLLSLIGILAGSASVEAQGLLGWFKPTPPPVLTVTDFTSEGRKRPQPTPQNPIYYEAISFGSRNFQGLHGDPAPNPRAMVNLIVSALEKNGYLQAKEKGQATIFLSISWGYSRANLGTLRFLGGDKMDLMWELESLPMISPNVLRRGMRSREAEMIMEAAMDDLYIASIKAFDLLEIDQGREVPLWHTRIACSATGVSMKSSIPVMIIAAAPMIGRDLDKPVWVKTDEIRKGNVEIGEALSLEYLEAPRQPAGTK